MHFSNKKDLCNFRSVAERFKTEHCQLETGYDADMELFWIAFHAVASPPPIIQEQIVYVL